MLSQTKMLLVFVARFGGLWCPLHMKFDCPLPELNCHISVTVGGDHGGTVEARSPFLCVVYLNALS